MTDVASIRSKRLGNGKVRYYVLFRLRGTQTCETFIDEPSAERFRHLVAAVGPQAAITATFPAGLPQATAGGVTVGEDARFLNRLPDWPQQTGQRIQVKKSDATGFVALLERLAAAFG